MIYAKQINKTSTLLIAVAASLFLLATSFSFFLSQPVSAQSSSTLGPCEIKVNKEKCEAFVEAECESSDAAAKKSCQAGKATKYQPVYKECRKKQRPQACHKALVKDCKGKSGSALKTCKRERAKDFKTGTPSTTSTDDEISTAAKGEPANECGEGDDAVKTRFDFGCSGTGSPIQDLAYSIIRFLSMGVGLVLVASIIYAGIMYSSSEGNPEATQAAKKRVQNAVTALVFYMFIFALVQYLVPGGLFAS